eukprot:TRINITY_DN44592_c0_g1_i1.p1 TRINITY_DN44592_c0_g1~~TRINITY_DN44592_c0_g1_i1.p1  ORF type:complete len:130 (-),score=12.72 TRINITY_DN44592_c0_g1_i1:58-447(-)
MELFSERLLAARFVTVGLQLALTASVMSASRDFVARSLSNRCSSSGPGCLPKYSGEDDLDRQAAEGETTSCGLGPQFLKPTCRTEWDSLEWPFLLQLRIAIALLGAELVALLSGVHSARNEVTGLSRQS